MILVAAAVLGAAMLVGLMGAGEARYPTTTQASAVRFTAVRVFVDSKGKPLAAYQCEISAKSGDVKIVGIEGNPKIAAFADPPYYDPKAMIEDRLILAAFSTRKDLPKGNMHVATIHVQVTGDAKPEYTIKLDVTASVDGKPVPATASVVHGG